MLQPIRNADEAAISTPSAVRWFEVPRGFGFGFGVADDPRLDDVVVPLEVLKAHGRRSLPEGARIDALVVETAGGLQVSKSMTIDLSQVANVPPFPLRDWIDPPRMSGSAGPLGPR